MLAIYLKICYTLISSRDELQVTYQHLLRKVKKGDYYESILVRR